MKFETEIQFAFFSVNMSKPEVPRPYNMAADAIFAKPDELNKSSIYYPILMEFET